MHGVLESAKKSNSRNFIQSTVVAVTLQTEVNQPDLSF